MIQFLAPLSLFALAALLAPLLIHLLSRKAGKRVKVGSIKFLLAAESRHLKSLKLSELALLLLRCALLAVLVLLLAQPQWLSSAPQPTSQELILVAPDLLQAPAAGLLQELDSLTRAGNELRLLVSGFPRWHSSRVQNEHENYWSLMRELETRMPNQAVRIFSSNAIRHYRGERPALPANIKWQTFSTAPTRPWLHYAKLTLADSVQLLVSRSEAEHTTFARFNLHLPSQPTILSEPGIPPVEMLSTPTGRALRLVQGDTAENNIVRIIEEPKTVAIYFDEHRTDDKRYVHAALEAVAGFAAVPLRVRTTLLTGNGQSWEGSAFVFWLSDRPVPDSLLRRLAEGTILFTDAGARPYQTVTSSIITEDASSVPLPRLWRRVAAQAHREVLWKEGWGEPLLEAEQTGAVRHYHFHSRFHPQWNELVLHPSFPELLLRLIEQNEAVAAVREPFEQRRLSAAQIRPQEKSIKVPGSPATSATSLQVPFWLLAAGLFVLERWFSERRRA